jgi:hypothetical protein
VIAVCLNCTFLSTGDYLSFLPLQTKKPVARITSFLKTRRYKLNFLETGRAALEEQDLFDAFLYLKRKIRV